MARSITGFRPSFWPTVITAVGVTVLLALGGWQLQRLSWKLNLIHTIQSRITAPAVPLPAGTDIDPDAWNYKRVTVSGHFLNDKEMRLLAYTERGNLGYHLITPLVRADGAGTVLVDRGWVPAAQREPASRPGSTVDGDVTVEGVVRRGGHRTLFVPVNDPARNEWFYADLAQMAVQAGVQVPPILVELVAKPGVVGLPLAGQTEIHVRNNHLEYALTWFGLAIALAVIFFLSQRRKGDASNGGRNEGERR